MSRLTIRDVVWQTLGLSFMTMDTPPTTPGPLPSGSSKFSWRGNSILLGMAIHAACVGTVCAILPLAMGSNIWPIATVFWLVLTIPVSLGTGALLGLFLRRCSTGIRIAILIATGIVLAAVVGTVMAQS